MLRFVFDLDIPLLNGRVPFQRTAYELVRRCSRAEIPEGILKDQVCSGCVAAVHAVPQAGQTANNPRRGEVLSA